MSKKADAKTKFQLVRKTESSASSPAAPAAESSTSVEVVYSFPSKSRCPRCGSLDTKRTGSYRETQYRECKAPVCGKKYPVVGTRL